ncbi:MULTISPECIES: DUF3251 domain-containing protein [Tenebrionibacter/Tenebrionicola group]|jgi:hypothetical protein|uniref:DUF3251 domain-containing protein n=2 Tax=Tenebrionibacter/Tenebrionicola group TaxID=2969848 RepID=A0A8K0V0K0_9ENTR|nr:MULTISPECIES: DUF3251 domain-containing protein [Tenebrionibacter/Tenebrionicola group]MBK4714593.1 DUF3251 domain-containing protein [Tenebrionibacter intestinalis]MBV4413763.1 DUF3251 domain-containing protein [Tenebrionicola larvae]MBV5095047.1 DUF3251 domain-containing protein [Tenebrionicola larvae]
MARQKVMFFLAGGLLTSAACAAQAAEVGQVARQVNALNQQMEQLSQQAIKLKQQNALNAKSTTGVYLLPGSQTPAQLKSQLGMLQMSLTHLTAVANGARATLNIQGDNSGPLPAFTAQVVWGQITGTTDSYDEVNTHSLTVSAPASILVPSDVAIPLDMPGIQPGQLGFVRIHAIQPTDANWQAPPRSPFSQ